MAGLLQHGGAPPHKPSRFVPIVTQRFFSGLWTNRSPFSGGGDDRYRRTYLGDRSDVLIDGANMELTNYGTYIRRPGFLPYTSGLPAPILSFYGFHRFTGDILVMADTATGVYLISVNGVVQTPPVLIFTKTTNAQMYFQGVGNTLFMGDGVDLRKWWGGTNGQAVSTPAIVPGQLSSIAGGTLKGSRTYFVKLTYTNPNGETTPGPEQSITIDSGNNAPITSLLLKVKSPAAIAGATG